MNICEKIKIEILKCYIRTLNIPYDIKYEMLLFIDNYSHIREFVEFINYISYYHQYGYYL